MTSEQAEDSGDRPHRETKHGDEPGIGRVAMSAHAATSSPAFSQVPEPGQLVRARGRSWVVAEVDRSELDRPQHLVSLTSVEDDAFDETVQLLWEVEPGTRVMERATLPTPHPDRFDDPDRLAAFWML